MCACECMPPGGSLLGGKNAGAPAVSMLLFMLLVPPPRLPLWKPATRPPPPPPPLSLPLLESAPPPCPLLLDISCTSETPLPAALPAPDDAAVGEVEKERSLCGGELERPLLEPEPEPEPPGKP